MVKKDVKKVVLAYSGGLDTSVILKWLQTEYGCEVVTFTADLGQGGELEPARKKAEMLGIKEIFVDDLREEFVRDFVFPMFRANALYEGVYLLGTSIARPLIAKRLVEIAKASGADAVALTIGSHEAVGPAIKLVRNQGTINLFAGFPPGKTVPFDPNVIHYGEINLTGSQNATTDQYRRTINMLAHVPHIDEVVTNRYDIEHGPEAYTSRLSMNGLKSLVQFAGVDPL